MKFPVALVAAVLIWSSSRYLPPYFLEMRKMDLAEHQLEVSTAKQTALLKALRTQIQAHLQAKADESDPNKRFY